MSKREQIERLVADISTCRRCSLWEKAKNAVPGEGNPDAELMFIGEAPGYWEDIRGRPFVGDAGKLLDELISGIGLQRNDVYIGNIVKHRPPLNREPRADEVEACAPYLDKQVEIIRPRIIVTLGRHSTKYILLKANIEVNAISAVRGRSYMVTLFGLSTKVMSTLHPAAALYNPRNKSILEEDFRKIRDELKGTI